MKAMYVDTKKVEGLYIGSKKVELAYVGKKLSYAVTPIIPVPEETCEVTVNWSGVSSVARKIKHTGQIITYTQEDSSVDETTFYAYEGDTLAAQAKEYYTFAPAGSVLHKNSTQRGKSFTVDSTMLSLHINPIRYYGVNVVGSLLSTATGIYAYKESLTNAWTILASYARWINPSNYVIMYGTSLKVNDKYKHLEEKVAIYTADSSTINSRITQDPSAQMITIYATSLGEPIYEY